jgi:hypothetical protein
LSTNSHFFALNISLPVVLTIVQTMSYAQVDSSDSNDLFDSDEVLEITLSGNMSELMDDRGDDPQYHPFKLTYSDKSAGSESIDIQIRTRGHFRKIKGNCTYPPFMLNFSKSEMSPSSYFFGQGKMKLVTPCRGDKYVIREYLVYELYNLVTDKSFRARLVRVVYEDTEKNSISEPLYGVLLEDEDKMAERNQSKLIERELVRPEHTQRGAFLKMAVFEYLIGNTDWSIQYLQNIKLLVTDSTGIPPTVPYDFDHSGIVGAPYAKPAEQLQMTSIRQRRYRGFCMEDMDEFKKVFDFYNNLKPDIYKVYTENNYLDEKSLKSTLKFLDEFYETINDPKKSERDFTYPCLPGGTGNVVIRGLKQ